MYLFNQLTYPYPCPYLGWAGIKPLVGGTQTGTGCDEPDIVHLGMKLIINISQKVVTRFNTNFYFRLTRKFIIRSICTCQDNLLTHFSCFYLDNDPCACKNKTLASLPCLWFYLSVKKCTSLRWTTWGGSIQHTHSHDPGQRRCWFWMRPGQTLLLACQNQ